jgi:hypothetical protein
MKFGYIYLSILPPSATTAWGKQVQFKRHVSPFPFPVPKKYQPGLNIADQTKDF